MTQKSKACNKVVCWVGEASHDDAKVLDYMLKDILPLSLTQPDDEISDWGGEKIPVFQAINTDHDENGLLETTEYPRREKEVIRLRNQEHSSESLRTALLEKSVEISAAVDVAVVYGDVEFS
ncbi:hypothetical protein GLAREA_00510 [Glarea lozoyensis ATCC 20868]|uniref:Uncharacterized protein n=1 Tax=Glarea lozoyensis (strain ATCC 20868 / MF5171) TaxID=1116229 RepID=S3CUP7_GLAL2|nr:uncharacterized protein GLAREA_00510 [Glarea lozoyensis ATCC 20868]EPE29350.1 hypothetical protein GLAREA_00510 [Glarea lozoyensis ATCC 20868]